VIHWLSAALAGADDPTLDRIAALEWDRQPPVQFQSQLAGSDVATRVTAVRALGRLRTADAVETLAAWTDDPEPAVRVAVAQAFGWTPGAAEQLRTWWRRADGEPDEVTASIVLAIGRQGDVRDVQALLTALGERGPVGVAAARALGTLASRGTLGLELAVEPLVAALDTWDPAKVDAVAWALARIRKPVPEQAVPDLLRALDAGPSPEARAWLVKAVWPTLPDEERTERFLIAMTDAPRLVQVAVLGALGPDDAEPAVLSGFLHDRDPWIRYATIDAIGRHPDASREEVLRGHLARVTDPWEQARVVRALHVSDPGAAEDAGTSTVVRAAWVEALDDDALLVRYAAQAPEPVIRSAAAGAWAERPPTAPAIERLLAAADPLVRQLAADRAGELPPKVAAPLLRTLLSTEADPVVRAQGWATLDAALQADKRALPAKDAKLKPAFAALGVAEAATVAHATAVAKVVGLPAPTATVAPAPASWRVPLGEETFDVVARPADLAAIRTIRSARISTDQGEFVVALDPVRAPLAVATFASLAEAGYFDGQVFHRVVPGFVAQTGCPRGDGWGGPGFTLPDEDSELPFDAGSLGMAREDARDTAGSQWFVTTSDQPHLTSEYTRFGEVVHGLYVAQQLRQGAVVEDVVIERVP
jgi:cyclophilin family peptidyl-prolyl cis-trans isomerase/HEAT repeat protein